MDKIEIDDLSDDQLDALECALAARLIVVNDEIEMYKSILNGQKLRDHPVVTRQHYAHKCRRVTHE